MESRRLASEIGDMDEVAKRVFFAMVNLEDETSGRTKKVLILPKDAKLPAKPTCKHVLEFNSCILTILEFEDRFVIFVTTKTHVLIAQVEDNINSLLGITVRGSITQSLLVPYPLVGTMQTEDGGLNSTEFEIQQIMNQMIDESRPSKIDEIYQNVAIINAQDEKSDLLKNVIDSSTTVSDTIKKFNSMKNTGGF